MNLPESISFVDGRKISYIYEYNICDNLGNVQAVVDGVETVKQQSNYYPFGGVFAQAGSPDNKYLYNGKEKQEGTDWLDYGHRMFSLELGRFMTIDRFAEKYSNITPYHYCANDPIKHIDVKGDSIVVNGTAEFKQKVTDALNLLKQSDVGLSLYNTLTSSDNVFTILESSRNRFKSDSYGEDDSQENLETLDSRGNIHIGNGNGTGGEIRWNSDNTIGAIDENGNRVRDPKIALCHEMGHAYDANSGTMDRRRVLGLKYTEWKATHIENQIRSELGVPLRKYYGVRRVNRNGVVLRITGTHQLIYGTIRAIDSSYDYSVLNGNN